MRINMLGNKIGSTQIFNEEGERIPVTVLKVGPCFIVNKKTEKRDGYNALVLAYEDVKKAKVKKSRLGIFKKANVLPKKVLKESRMGKEYLDKFKIGQEIDLDIFNKGDFIDVTGKSKGRGFSGVMKRHGMSGANKSHGTHEYFRHGGSIGSSAYPARVFKGKKMPGRYGAERVTIQNLKIVDIMPDKHIMLVRGAIPGPNRAYISVSSAVKKVATG